MDCRSRGLLHSRFETDGHRGPNRREGVDMRYQPRGASSVWPRRRSWRFGVLLGVLFAAAVLSACGGGSDSERTAMSLDEYVESCAGATAVELDEEIDLETFSAAAAEQIGVLESIEPPDEVAAWHDAVLAYLRALQDTLDDAPEGEGDELDAFLFSAVFSLALEHGPALEGAVGATAPEVRERLAAAGCLDGEESSDSDYGELSDFDDGGMPDEPAPAPTEDPELTTPAGSVTSVDEYARRLCRVRRRSHP